MPAQQSAEIPRAGALQGILLLLPMTMAVMGLVLFSTIAVSSPFLQNVIGYPIITAGLLLATRGCGT